jgi:hypothetical protein
MSKAILLITTFFLAFVLNFKPQKTDSLQYENRLRTLDSIFHAELVQASYELEMNPLSLSGFGISIPVDKRKLIVNDDTKTE